MATTALKAVRQFRVRELAPVLRQQPTASTPASKTKAVNPFLPRKNPESGRWAPPKYSLRRQADLVKAARASGTLHLLPPGPKVTLKELDAAVASASSSATASSTAETTAKRTDKWWGGAVDWQGEYKERAVKGADVGNRLYAGKKRMFKGHKWERTMERRKFKREILMKGMAARIARFKTTYKRKTPNPISPARAVSYSKLPF